MSILGLILLVIAGLVGISWWRLLKGKELARFAAARTCKQHGLVLMDDTVMLDSVQLKKEDPVNAWGLKYRFDFAHKGILHKGGIVILAPGHRPVTVIETSEGPLIEHQ
ncbi:MAG: DUF3301 domain-containing protein [Xanthomonadales bacterium]|jgi:hypothetical protein|nr:DUF3301 domain-containing protein [Xanthomonadales bacterium]